MIFEENLGKRRMRYDEKGEADAPTLIIEDLNGEQMRFYSEDIQKTMNFFDRLRQIKAHGINP